MNISDKITGNSYTAAEFNQFKNETQNTITSTGLSLASSSTQLKEALKRYALSGAFFVDSGAADAYVLNVVGSYGAITAYIDGMRCFFIANATNTGTSTVNVSGLGATTIKKQQFSTDLSAGDIEAGKLYEIQYDSSSGFFNLIKIIEGGYIKDGSVTGQILTWNNTSKEWDVSASQTPLTTFIKDEKASTTQGGTFTSGAWRTRDLNTQTGNTSFSSVVSNQIIISTAGTYIVEATAPARAVNDHVVKLYNISDASDEIIGSTTYANPAASEQTISHITGEITIASSKTFEIQHQCQTTRATDGFGTSSGFGVNEVYTQVKITKIA